MQIVLLLATGVALDLRPWLAGLRLHWPWVVGVLSVGSYPLLAFLEGFLAARTGQSAAGRAVGQVVGGMSALTVAIPIAVLMVSMLSAPPPTGG